MPFFVFAGEFDWQSVKADPGYRADHIDIGTIFCRLTRQEPPDRERPVPCGLLFLLGYSGRLHRNTVLLGQNLVSGSAKIMIRLFVG